MDWEKQIKAFDKSGVKSIIESFPENCITGYNLGKKFPTSNQKNIKNILVCGMGGSGFSGMIAQNALRKKLKIPITVNTRYELPEFVDKHTLLLAVSYSGNTEETIQAVEEAKKRNAIIVGFSSGGRLAELCKNKVIVPAGIPPRMSIPFLFFSLVGVLEKFSLIEINESSVKEVSLFLQKEKHLLTELSRNLALELINCFPIIYSTEELECLALRFQTDLNENAKVLAHPNVIPEMNHNEINATRLPEKSGIVFLLGKNENQKIMKRIDFTEKTFKERGLNCTRVEIKGSTPLEQLSYGVMLSCLFHSILPLPQARTLNPFQPSLHSKKSFRESEKKWRHSIGLQTSFSGKKCLLLQLTRS